MSGVRFLFVRAALSGLVFCFSAYELFAQPFTYTYVGTQLPRLGYGAIAYADIDRDNDLDLVASGNSALFPPFRPVSLLVWNTAGAKGDLSGDYPFQESPLSDGVWHASIAPADFDGDNDIDVLITGASSQNPPFDPVIGLFENDGNGSFREVGVDFEAVYSGSAAWGDYDADGRPDLLLTGVAVGGSYVTRLYRNEGGGIFQEILTNLPGLGFGSAEWADIDEDGDADLLVTGILANGRFLCSVFRNEGAGSFSEEKLATVAFGDASWGDYDSDGDFDVLVSGGVFGKHILEGTVAIFENLGTRFRKTATSLEGVFFGSAAWGDYDGDGLLDILLSGATDALGLKATRIYQNQGSAEFVHRVNVPGTVAAPAVWADHDNDGDLDLAVAGITNNSRPVFGFFSNDRRTVNIRPTPPSDPRASVSGRNVVLSWRPGSDAETSEKGLSYNVRVGTQPGASDVLSAAASPVEGHRFLSGYGNAGLGSSLMLRDLPPGTYYWTVQTVDNGFHGSRFAPEGSFVIRGSTEGSTTPLEADRLLPTQFGLTRVFPNPFNASTSVTVEVPQQEYFTLGVFDVLGKKVSTLVSGHVPAGRHEVQWNGCDDSGRKLASGIYFLRLQARSHTWTSKVLLVN